MNHKTSGKLHWWYFCWFKWLFSGLHDLEWTMDISASSKVHWLYQKIKLGRLLFYLIALCSCWGTGGVLTAKFNKIIICTSTYVVLGQRQSYWIVNCLFSEDQLVENDCCLLGLCTEQTLSCCEWELSWTVKRTMEIIFFFLAMILKVQVNQIVAVFQVSLHLLPYLYPVKWLL